MAIDTDPIEEIRRERERKNMPEHVSFPHVFSYNAKIKKGPRGRD